MHACMNWIWVGLKYYWYNKIKYHIIICCCNWYSITPSLGASIVTPAHIVFHCGLILVTMWFIFSIGTLVVATSMCPEIFSKYEVIGWWGWPWRGPMEGVGGLMLLVLPLSPMFAESIHIRSWFWARLWCIISAVPVAVGGDGSSGGTLFSIFDWCWN